MHYFKYFPTVTWEDFVDGVHEKKTVVNLTAYTTIASKLIDDVSYYSYVTIPQGDRPDNLSYSLYGTTDYYWTFFIINDHLRNLYTDWPMTDSQLMDWIESKYPGIAIYPQQVGQTDFSHSFFNLDIGDILSSYFDKNSTDTEISQKISVEVKNLFPTNGWIQAEYIDPSKGQFKFGDNPVIAQAQVLKIDASTNKSDIGESFLISEISKAYDAPHHYENEEGEVVATNPELNDRGERVSLTSSSKDTTLDFLSQVGIDSVDIKKHHPKIRPVSFVEYEKRANINRSYIRVIKPEFIKEVSEKFRLAMKEQQE
jgi:hypothetical protein